MRLMGRDSACPLAMGEGGKQEADEAPLSVLTVPSQSLSYRHSDVAQLIPASVLSSAGREMDSNSRP